MSIKIRISLNVTATCMVWACHTLRQPLQILFVFFFFFESQKAGSVFHSHEEDGGDKRLAELLLAKLMMLHRQILFSLVIAAIAEPIRMRTSAEVLSLHRVAPRYLKLVTSSNFGPFKLISWLMLFVLLVMNLLFSSTSSANRGSHIGLLPMEMDMWWSWSVSCMIFSRNKLNRISESRHPWRTHISSWRTPRADYSGRFLCWSSYIVLERLEPVPRQCWSFWAAATGLLARLCQKPSWSLWSCGTDRDSVVGASLWWLEY